MQCLPVVLLATLGLTSGYTVAAGNEILIPQIRRPVALALVEGDELYVGNRRSGTISVIDTQALRVIGSSLAVKVSGI